MPDSPPDSGSEHPYSPQESCDQPINQEIIYTTLGNPNQLYKDSSILNPILAENLILSSSIVVPGQRHQSIIQSDNLVTTEGRFLVQNTDGADPRLMEGKLLVQNQDGSDPRLMGSLTHLDGLGDGRHMIITTQDNTDAGNRILIQPGPSSQGITPENKSSGR